MILIIESIILCIVFTLMVYIISREPIKTLYNYPPKIQERVNSLDEYKGKIPTKKNKVFAKSLAIILIIIIISLILKYINGYITFKDGCIYCFILWTIVNLYDLLVLDIIWFCHDKYFILKGTEDMTNEYHNYWFHTKGFIIGELLAIFVSIIVGALIQFIL